MEILSTASAAAPINSRFRRKGDFGAPVFQFPGLVPGAYQLSEFL
jgi:hypothetical protein